MQLTLRLKMFLVLVASSIILILSMLFFTLSSFEVGVNEYLDDVNEQRMGKLSQRLAQLYQQQGSFEFLEEEPVLVAALEGLLWEGESEVEHLGAIPEEEFAEIERYYEPIFFIIGTDRNLIYGNYEPELPARFTPIRLGQDNIGWLGIPEEAFGKGSVTYVEAQTREFWVIALIMVLVSMLVALLSANHLQKRIRPIIEGTRALTKGRYATRIQARGTDELGELASDFNQLAQTLEQNELARRQWVEDISHELKTPLTLISGEIEAARDGIREVTPATLELLSQDVARLNHLVDDLKTLWQSEPGALQLDARTCHLDELVLQSLDPFRTPLAQKQVRIKTELASSAKVCADHQRLSQVMQNIFSNTLRYTEQGCELHITLDKTAAQWRLVVEDSGPGVSDDDLGRLFDRLYRVERSRNRSTGGAGIGLAICRNIVLAHGGGIKASHSPLGGLAITLHLPEENCNHEH